VAIKGINLQNIGLLKAIVATVVRNINAAGIFADNLRKELSSYFCKPLTESSGEYSFLRAPYDDLSISGWNDNCYRKYYVKVPLTSTSFYSCLSRNPVPVLSTEVSDSFITYNMKERERTKTTAIATSLNERDLAGLLCQGGFILHKLYRKHVKANIQESEQATAILEAGKLEVSAIGVSTQKLIVSSNRGELWSIIMPTQRIFAKID